MHTKNTEEKFRIFQYFYCFCFGQLLEKFKKSEKYSKNIFVIYKQEMSFYLPTKLNFFIKRILIIRRDASFSKDYHTNLLFSVIFTYDHDCVAKCYNSKNVITLIDSNYMSFVSSLAIMIAGFCLFVVYLNSYTFYGI